MIIERQTTTASVENEFIFQVKAQDFTVKNFTEGNIFVSDVTPVIKEKAIMIPPQAGQDITMGKQIQRTQQRSTHFTFFLKQLHRSVLKFRR